MVETYSIDKAYRDVGWFRPILYSRVSKLIDSIPTNCECSTLKSNKCCSSPSYMCVSHQEPSNVLYVCGVHLRKINTEEHCVIYKRVSKREFGGYIDFEVIQQVYSPDTYFEYCFVFNNIYTKMLNNCRTSLDNRDFRAIQIGDQDGSYPREMERLTHILDFSRSVVGFDLYNCYKRNYKEIERLRDSYIKVLNVYQLLYDRMNYIPEIKFFNENNILCLTFKHEDTCSICFENVLPLDGGQLKMCGHTFHNTCLTKWLSYKSDEKTCPCCRNKLHRFLFEL